MAREVSINYRPDLALQLCEEIAQGRTIAELVAQEDSPYPSRATLYRWIMQYPELAKAYAAAREISANSFEEEALMMAREIKLHPDNNTKIRAYEVAMGQLRWSASRRNPREYGDKGNTNIVVPITINTPLDMGGGGGAGSASIPNIYDLKATVPQVIDAEYEDAQPQPPPFVQVPEASAEPLLSPKRRTISGRHIQKKRSMTGKAIREARRKYAEQHGET